MADGTVLTFYSYKGGVGRSFALANIAVILARWGHRVLCLDWDLEAPGLLDYFRPTLDAEPPVGVLELVEDFRAGRTEPRPGPTRCSGLDGLDLLPAGGTGPDYVGRVQKLDWAQLYDDGLGEYLERCRQQWVAEYDYVLIDSRTGVSDIGGICTAHLPDRLVLLFTANVQSIRGAVEIAGRADVARDRLTFDRSQLTVVPVLSRFDTREEYQLAEGWRTTCVTETRALYENWLHRGVPVELMSRHLTLPYVSFWSFGERLAVREEDNPTADQLGYALETVAAVLAHDLDRTDLLAENRDTYVAAARDVHRSFDYDLLVSTPRSVRDTAAALMGALGGLGLRVAESISGDRSELDRVGDRARHLCVLVDSTTKRWQATESELFLHRTLSTDRRVIPILTEGTDASALPGYLRNLRHLRIGRDHGPAAVARELRDELDGARAADHATDELLGLLTGLDTGRLRPTRWQLVGDLLRELLEVLSQGPEADRLDGLVRDLAANVGEDTTIRTEPPPAVLLLRDQVVRELGTRAGPA